MHAAVACGDLVVFAAEAEMACGNVVVLLHWLGTVFECCVNGLCVRQRATAFVCLRWRQLSWASVATAFVCVGGRWRWMLRIRGRRLATALFRGVARGNYCEG